VNCFSKAATSGFRRESAPTELKPPVEAGVLTQYLRKVKSIQFDLCRKSVAKIKARWSSVKKYVLFERSEFTYFGEIAWPFQLYYLYYLSRRAGESGILSASWQAGI